MRRTSRSSLSGNGGDFLAKDADAAGIGFEEASCEFEEQGLPGARFAEEDHRLAFLGGEIDAAENFTFRKAETDVLEFDGGLAGGRESGGHRGGGRLHRGSEKFVGEVEGQPGEKGV